MNSDIESLMSQYLDGRMTAAEAAELSRILIEDPEAAARFAELTRVDESLRVVLKAESRSEIFAARLRSKSRAENEAAKTATPDRRRWLAAAAGLAVLGGTAWWFTRDGTVPAVVMDWAKSRVKQNSGGHTSADSGNLASAGFNASLPIDEAAALRRKLRNFAIPYLHLRSMPVSDALNTLARQWTSLPHVREEDAEKVKISLADSVRKRWPTTDKEPLVSADIPNLSLHTALNLIAVQAGLKLDVAADAVTLLADESPKSAAAGAASRPAGPATVPEELKTWTFPLTKPVADTFLTSLNQRQQPPDGSAAGSPIAGQTAPPVTWAMTFNAVSNPGGADAQNAEGTGGSAASPQSLTALSFRLPTVSTDAATTAQKVEVGIITEGSGENTADIPITADGGEREGVQAGDPVLATGDHSVEAPLQEQPDLPSLATAGAVTEDDSTIHNLSYSFATTADASVADGAQPTGISAAGIARNYYAAQNNQTNQATVPGVENTSTEVPGLRVRMLPEEITFDGSSPEVTVTMMKGMQPGLEQLSQSWLMDSAAQSVNNIGIPGNGKPVILSTRFVNSIQPDWKVIWTEASAAPTLDSWLTSLGAGTIMHDTENNALSVTGTAAELRTAAAAVAALTESVQWGVSLDARFIELGDLPKPELNHAGGRPSLSAGEVEKLCKTASSTPGSACVRLPAVPGALEKAIEFKIENGASITTAQVNIPSDDGSISRTASGDASRAPQLFLKASVTAVKQGERWTLTTSMKDGSSELNNKTSAMDGSWIVIESTNGRYLLIRPRSTSVSQ